MIRIMNKKIVLDASALLALLNQENGYEKVETALPNSMISSVNYSETIAVLSKLGVPEEEAKELTHSIIPDIIPFDTEQAHTAAILRKQTQSHGLSLGDRACLALAEKFKARVLTADKVWGKLSLENVKIDVIR
jgi:ribonuclease VapC